MKQRINVTFATAESTALLKVKATEQQLANKTVILEKLNRFRSVLGSVESIGEALSLVLCS